ncbi:uncharacterized protein N7515_001287 [Penicillium bovifimosum]|uniref:Uncharacterized protein n=1 Tax=Penicillium bovifimosum TaxID=126998 RepID=A0A9W9L711_9EURO|nr:uncharacterized protein N7515_001287 [Penicillium bovifimosum]KAJ5142500.1 hypothetical protein N7515_001287 [Penicillium bovifimosum]
MGILQHPGSGEKHSPFASQLRDALASANHFNLWSIPESVAGTREEDCPDDMESQSSAERSHMTRDEEIEHGADPDWAGSPVSMDKFLGCLQDLNARLQSIEEQLVKQNVWNDDMGQGVKEMQGGYQGISALSEEVATLKEQLNALRRGSPGSGRKPGRPRRVAQ